MKEILLFFWWFYIIYCKWILEYFNKKSSDTVNFSLQEDNHGR